VGRSVTPGLRAPRARPTCADPSRPTPRGYQCDDFCSWRPPGPPLAPPPLFNWEASTQLGTPRPVNPAIWSGLERSLGELTSIRNNGVDQTFIMALSCTLVRLGHEAAAIVFRPLEEQDTQPLYHLGTAEELRHLLMEENGTAVVTTRPANHTQ